LSDPRACARVPAAHGIGPRPPARAHARIQELRCQQAIRHRIAEIAVEIEAGRDVTYSALRRHVAGEDAAREVTIAKLRTQRSAFDTIDACVQIHGLDAPAELERALRDAGRAPSVAAPTRS
jgi:alkylation response protein AidB-like acyl-CoA dehydrogenase